MTQNPTPLEVHLQQLLKTKKFLTVGDFMAQALGHETYGYYRSRQPLGPDGDFTTAPEISQIFGELIGGWVMDCWHRLGCPKAFDFVELGPGRGTLMADALRVASRYQDFYKAVQVHLVEINPVLIKTQKESLRGHKQGHKVVWHEDINFLSDNQGQKNKRPVIIIANEFFDALPVRQLIWQQKHYQERVIRCNEKGAFIFGSVKAPQNLLDLIPASLKETKPSEGGILELSPVIISVVQELAQVIARRQGYGLFIDYGYKKTSFGESLQALHRHKPVSIFFKVGQTDLTTHVNFERLAFDFTNKGCVAYPPIEQGRFLTQLGLPLRVRALCQRASVEVSNQIFMAAQRLVGEAQMGSLFKVFAARGPQTPECLFFQEL